jgi:hypothetical protein
MIIRSQDKTRCVNFNNVLSIQANSKKVYAEIDMTIDGYFTIGEYSTEEKAIKVLDMIAFNYAFEQTIKNNQGTGCQVTLEPFVFQMPQDSEVTV